MTIKIGDAALIEFRSADNQITMSVHLDSQDETVWLNLNQISQLFQRDKSVISRHLKKIFETSELEKESTVAFFATVQEEGGHHVTRNIEFFNLDVILSVGYRVNSKKGVEFRRWASKVLKDHLVKGFSLNNERLLTSGIKDLTRSLDLLKDSLVTHGHITDIGSAAIDIINSYTKAWLLLNAFDEDRLQYPQKHQDHEIRLTENMIIKGILELKDSLLKKKEATSLFGNERQDAFKQIIGSIKHSGGKHFIPPFMKELPIYFILRLKTTLSQMATNGLEVFCSSFIFLPMGLRLS